MCIALRETGGEVKEKSVTTGDSEWKISGGYERKKEKLVEEHVFCRYFFRHCHRKICMERTQKKKCEKKNGLGWMGQERERWL